MDDDISDGSDLIGLATATAFLYTLVMTIFGMTDLYGGERSGAGELSVASFSAVTFAVLLARPKLA